MICVSINFSENLRQFPRTCTYVLTLKSFPSPTEKEGDLTPIESGDVIEDINVS